MRTYGIGRPSAAIKGSIERLRRPYRQAQVGSVKDSAEGRSLERRNGPPCRSRTMIIVLPAFVLALFVMGCAAAGAAYSAEIDVHGALESFVWKEFVDSARLLKESGVLTGVGISYRNEYSDRLILDESAEIFGGRVGYDGSTQTGVPTTSTVDYFVLKLKGDVGKSFSIAGPYSLEPFAGLGYRTWLRHIRNGTTSAGRPVQGYTEQWMTLYVRLGARSGLDISENKRLFAEAGVKLPLYNQNTAYLDREGIGPDVTMHPGWDWSVFAEAGMRIDGVKAAVFYDGLRFTRSEDVGTLGTHQPRSTADIYGVSIGVLF